MEKNPIELQSVNSNSSSSSKSLAASQINQTVFLNPLFSCIITFYTLILLYFPSISFELIFSPVLISTGILLLCILRLGKTQKEFNSTEPPLEQKQQTQTHDYNYDNQLWDSCDSNSGYGYDPNPFFADSFVEWDVRAPLEIIYEAYEGEEEEGEDSDDGGGKFEEKQEKCVPSIDRYPSLSLYYPESDTDSSSDGDFAVIGDWDSPERMSFRWEEEDREGLIEIALDGKRRSQLSSVEEDNLIEIDISPARYNEISGEC